MSGFFRAWLTDRGLSASQTELLSLVALSLGVIALAVIANFITKRFIVKAVSSLARGTRTAWDDALVERGVFTRLSHLAPALVVWAAAPMVILGAPRLSGFARRGAEIYMIFVGLLALVALLSAVVDIYRQHEVSNRYPIRAYVQVMKILIYFGGGIAALSILLEKSPWVFLSGLGALTAVIMLIFKDSILGLVAGIQLVANDMVRPGDWIEMSKYGADGDVLEVTLNTVKIRNWDKTICMLPTYSLISESFVNWRGMTDSGGRRIKRSIHIDITSITFCTPEMIERFSRIQLLQDYIRRKQEELASYNREHDMP